MLISQLFCLGIALATPYRVKNARTPVFKLFLVSGNVISGKRHKGATL